MLTLSDLSKGSSPTSPASKVTSAPGKDEAGAAHSALGPSASDRWIPCPGSVHLTAGMKDEGSGYAMEGTAAHTLSEHMRVENKPASAYKGNMIPVDHQDGSGHTDYEVTQEMVDAVQSFVTYCGNIGGVAFYERRLSYSAWVPGGFGTADDIRINEPVVDVIDLKYGKGVQVFAEDNPQLKMYGLGVYQEFGHLYDIKEFRFTIHQPRLDHVDTWECSTQELLLWARDIVAPAAKAALRPSAKLQGGSHCRFCLARHTCKARSEWVFNQTIGDFEDLDDLEVRTKDFMSSRELGHALDALAPIKAWCSDMEAAGLTELSLGKPPVGKDGEYKMVAGKSSRSWIDPKKAEQALRNQKGLKVKQILVAKLVSPAQAEKLVGKKNEAVNAQILKSAGKPTMVNFLDPRANLTVDADKEFDDIT